MLKLKPSKLVKIKDSYSTKDDAVKSVSKDASYRNAGFKNSQIVLGHDTLKKLSAISKSHFNITLNIEKISQEMTGFVLSSLVNSTYNEMNDKNHQIMEVPKTLESMKLYHSYQAASFLYDSLSSKCSSKNIIYINIRENMDNYPTLYELIGLRCHSDIFKYWSNQAIDLILDYVWVNENIKKLNKQ